MADEREPYNSKYCKAVNCPRRSGNKCLESKCIRHGCEKRAVYFTQQGKLAEGDIPDA